MNLPVWEQYHYHILITSKFDAKTTAVYHFWHPVGRSLCFSLTIRLSEWRSEVNRDSVWWRCVKVSYLILMSYHTKMHFCVWNTITFELSKIYLDDPSSSIFFLAKTIKNEGNFNFHSSVESNCNKICVFLKHAFKRSNLAFEVRPTLIGGR